MCLCYFLRRWMCFSFDAIACKLPYKLNWVLLDKTVAAIFRPLLQMLGSSTNLFFAEVTSLGAKILPVSSMNQRKALCCERQKLIPDSLRAKKPGKSIMKRTPCKRSKLALTGRGVTKQALTTPDVRRVCVASTESRRGTP